MRFSISLSIALSFHHTYIGSKVGITDSARLRLEVSLGVYLGLGSRTDRARLRLGFSVCVYLGLGCIAV